MTTEDTSIATQAPAASQTDDNIIEGEVREVTDTSTEQTEGDAKPEEKPEAKPEKTAEQREIDRLRRGIDRRTRQLSDARAQLNLRPNNETHQQADDSEPLSLTRAQIAEMVTAEAQKLAPTLRNQAAEAERRQGVVQSLAKTWGQERFDEVSSDLDDVFGGLTDRSGMPKPAIEAVFESESPAAVIEWLTDPDNIDEAERISGLNAVQAGRAIAKLEAAISAKSDNAKPKPSKAPAPLEAVRGQGTSTGAPDTSKMTDSEWAEYRRNQKKSKS